MATRHASKRPRVNSNSTTRSDRHDSVFSDCEQPDDGMTPATNFSGEDDIVEIDKKTFEANIRKRKRADSFVETKNIVKGSTLGGIDPLHQLLQTSGIEPIHWREERSRKAAAAYHQQNSKRYSRAKRNATPPSQYLKPKRYETLPYSPQDYFTSGLVQDHPPEKPSKGFWAKVQTGWDASIRRESVEERRKNLGRWTYQEWVPGMRCS